MILNFRASQNKRKGFSKRREEQLQSSRDRPGGEVLRAHDAPEEISLMRYYF